MHYMVTANRRLRIQRSIPDRPISHDQIMTRVESSGRPGNEDSSWIEAMR